jgi:hypothetical protein
MNQQEIIDSIKTDGKQDYYIDITGNSVRVFQVELCDCGAMVEAANAVSMNRRPYGSIKWPLEILPNEATADNETGGIVCPACEDK